MHAVLVDGMMMLGFEVWEQLHGMQFQACLLSLLHKGVSLQLNPSRLTFALVIEAHYNAYVLHDGNQGQRPKDDGNSAKNLQWCRLF